MNFSKHGTFPLIDEALVKTIIKSVLKSLENHNSTAKHLSAETILNDMEYYDVNNLIAVFLFLKALMKLLLGLFKIKQNLNVAFSLRISQWRQTYL